MLAILSALVLAQTPAQSDAKWEKEITAIEKKLKDAKPGGVAFIGSSSIRLWDVKKSFPDWNAYNCGFGGSEIRNSTHFAKRLLVPLQPRAIVLYAGDNDIGAKRTPQQVRDDFAAFVKVIHTELPKAKIYWIPVKASIKRWALYDKQVEANGMVKAVIDADPLLAEIDVFKVLLGDDGKPQAKYFKADGLHLSPEGYAKWNAAVKSSIGQQPSDR